MCTVTIDRRDGSLCLTMNRDERWGRASEIPPVIHPGVGGGPAWIAPADGERGGSWCGVNADGIVAALLNGYAPGDLELLGRPEVPSRGDLVTALLALPGAEVDAWLDGLDPAPYPSFTLIAARPGQALEVTWLLGRQGLERRCLEGELEMVTSSFWRTGEVLAWRRERFERWRAADAPHREGVPELNLSEEEGRREFSIFMTRSFSATRSLTQATVSPAEIGLRYWRRDGDGPIDPTQPDACLRAPRRAGVPA